jgi:hypothetical protein
MNFDFPVYRGVPFPDLVKLGAFAPEVGLPGPILDN